MSAVESVLSGYNSGFKLVKGAHPDAIEHFVVISARGSPRLLLPATSPVMRTALKSFLGGRRFATLAPPIVQVASWIGGTVSRVSSDISLLSHDGNLSPLRVFIADVLGRSDFKIAMRLSFGRPNAKTVAMAVSDCGEALCYVKIGSDPMTSDLVAHEGSILEQFESISMPVIMPRRLYSGTWADGRSILITAPLELEPLKRDARSAHQAADALAYQNMVANSTLADSNYWRKLVASVEKYNESDYGAKTLLNNVAKIEQVWGDRNFDFGASHGDWTRANLGIVDGRVAALDWERCSKLAPRGIDIAHFAISENTSGFFGKAFSIERVTESVRQYLNTVGMQSNNAESLVTLALLEMVIRFKSAQSVGLQSSDSKFGPALQMGLQKWAV